MGINPVIYADREECSICLDEEFNLDPAVKLKCDHLFHQACIITWMSKTQNDPKLGFSCPNCRGKDEEIIPVRIRPPARPNDSYLTPAGLLASGFMDNLVVSMVTSKVSSLLSAIPFMKKS